MIDPDFGLDPTRYTNKKPLLACFPRRAYTRIYRLRTQRIGSTFDRNLELIYHRQTKHKCQFQLLSIQLLMIDPDFGLILLLPLGEMVLRRALDVRRNAIKDSSEAPSQVLDVAVSLAKVADVDRNLDAEDSTEGFQEAIKLLESLKINSEKMLLEQRRLFVLEFLNGQLSKKQSD
ncbi:hypothetical protein LXL04_029962 [Taraxacum kok-saghyz]